MELHTQVSIAQYCQNSFSISRKLTSNEIGVSTVCLHWPYIKKGETHIKDISIQIVELVSETKLYVIHIYAYVSTRKETFAVFVREPENSLTVML